MFIYLAHPIDQVNGTTSWLGSFIDTLKYRLSLAGIGAFLPGGSYLANPDDKSHADAINQINGVAQWTAHATVAVLPAGVPTLGTVAEIANSIGANKPTVIFTDIHSVQIHAWRDAGAIIVDIDDVDFKIPESDDLRTMLTFPPRLDELPVLGGPPPLLVHENGAANLQAPAYQGDAGMDLVNAQAFTLAPGEYQMVPTGVHVAIPEGYFGWLTGRSSAWTAHRLDVRTGIIDSGYRGELMLGLVNHNEREGTWSPGLRLGQLILIPAFTGGLQLVSSLPEHERGHNGWGSSGN